jgi:glycosyltransferase involved in cell wall biosynthesis
MQGESGRSFQQPLVSILIPAFNAERWIAQTIRSAISQTWKHKEIVIVDDGSTDRTLAIAQKFASDSVRVVAQPHRGASSARNFAFSLCKGDYIQWLDADDLLAPDKIALQIEAASQTASRRTLFSAPWATFLHRYYLAKFTPSPLWCDLSPTEWLRRKIAQTCFIQTGSWLVSRELTEAAGPWNISLLGDDDGEYFCRVVLLSDIVRFVPEAKAYYRYTGPGSLSYVGTSPAKLRAQWLSMKLHVSYLRSQHDSPGVRTACLNYLQRGLIEFYPESREILEEIYQLADELGGQLEIPKLPLKYSWIQVTLGWNNAKRVQRSMPRLRWWIQRGWDKAMFALDTRIGADLSVRSS